MSVDSALVRLLEWAEARRARLEVWRRLSAFACEWFDPGEMETGWQGTPYCYRSGLVNVDDAWCPTCQARDRVFAEMLPLRHAEREAYKRMRRAADTVAKHRHAVYGRGDEPTQADPAVVANVGTTTG